MGATNRTGITYHAEQAYEVCLAILEYILYALTQVVL
jgi:hypothetical protein